MRARDEIHVPAVLIPDDKLPVTTGQAAVWIPQSVLRPNVKWKLSCPLR